MSWGLKQKEGLVLLSSLIANEKKLHNEGTSAMLIKGLTSGDANTLSSIDDSSEMLSNGVKPKCRNAQLRRVE